MLIYVMHASLLPVPLQILFSREFAFHPHQTLHIWEFDAWGIWDAVAVIVATPGLWALCQITSLIKGSGIS